MNDNSFFERNKALNYTDCMFWKNKIHKAGTYRTAFWMCTIFSSVGVWKQKWFTIWPCSTKCSISVLESLDIHYFVVRTHDLSKCNEKNKRTLGVEEVKLFISREELSWGGGRAMISLGSRVDCVEGVCWGFSVVPGGGQRIQLALVVRGEGWYCFCFCRGI